METFIVSSLILALLVLPTYIWYVICDYVASTSTNYNLPHSCIRCNALLWGDPELSTRFITISREWHAPPLGIKALEYVFPYTERKVEVPVCLRCFFACERNKDRVRRLDDGIAAILVVGIVWGIAVGLIWRSILDLIVFLPFVYIPIAWLIAKVLKSLPPFATPAYFTILGRLRFRNKLYQWEFSRSNPEPEARLKHPPLPIGLFLGILVLLVTNLLTDIVVFLEQTRSSGMPTTGIIIILGKIISFLLIYYRKVKYGGILWFTTLGVSILTGFNVNVNGIVGLGILPIFIYEWWQGQLEF